MRRPAIQDAEVFDARRAGEQAAGGFGSLERDHESEAWNVAALEALPIWETLGAWEQELARGVEDGTVETEWAVAATEGLTLMATFVIALSLLRATPLAVLALSTLPMWRVLDPLAVLALTPEEREKRRKETEEAEREENTAGIADLLDGD